MDSSHDDVGIAESMHVLFNMFFGRTAFGSVTL